MATLYSLASRFTSRAVCNRYCRSAARLIYNMRSSDHITDALATLHWLRVPERITYKIAVLSYKVLPEVRPGTCDPSCLCQISPDAAFCGYQSASHTDYRPDDDDMIVENAQF